METKVDTKFVYLLIGFGLGAVGGLMSALLARKETRDLLRERSAKSLEYLDQQRNKLRKTTEEIVGKGKAMLNQAWCSEATSGNGTRADEETKVDP
jgi:gas vesicle protein